MLKNFNFKYFILHIITLLQIKNVFVGSSISHHYVDCSIVAYGWVKSHRHLFLKLWARNQNCLFHCYASNINGDVLATFRVAFSVSKIQQYSDNFVQDLLRAGLTSAMHGKPLEVPQFGQISGIILLGSLSVRSSVFCLWSCSCSILCTGTQMSRDIILIESTIIFVSYRSQWEIIL